MISALRIRPLMRDAALAGARVLLRGDAHECPCCERRFSRFIRRGDSLLCPRCRSLERQRTMWLYLRDELGIERSEARVLHLAPDAPLVGPLRAIPTLRYQTADISPGPLDDRTLDARALPFDPDSFELIICSHVLEHIPEDVEVARVFARVLAPGGTALVQVPVDPTLEETFEDPAIVTPAEREAAFGAGRPRPHLRGPMCRAPSEGRRARRAPDPVRGAAQPRGQFTASADRARARAGGRHLPLRRVSVAGALPAAAA